MYTVVKRIEVSGSHVLNLPYESKCSNLHGHNWIIDVTLQSETLDENGMVCTCYSVSINILSDALGENRDLSGVEALKLCADRAKALGSPFLHHTLTIGYNPPADSVDTVTERLIQDAIETVMAGRTSFVIAHRLSTIRRADLILVVQDGKIIEQGTHAQLMAARGHYWNLYTRQYREEKIRSTVMDNDN